jgi:replicative DNA helicase
MTTAAQMPDVRPHVNLQLEQQALGQILAYRDGWDLYTGAGLDGADLFRVAHRHEWTAMAAVAAAGVTPDIVTVGLELRRAGLLDEVGAGYHASLIDSVPRPSAEAAAFVAGELARLATLRAAASAIEGGNLSALGALVDTAQTRATSSRRVYDAAGQLDAIRVDADRDRAGRLWLGFPTLDDILGGLRAGEVLGWMARPGIGKTLVLCHITQHVAETEFGHVCFSLEMPAAQMVDRIAGQYFGLSRAVLRQRLDANALDTEAYARTFGRFVLVDAPGLDVATIAAKLRQIQAGPLRGIPIRLVTVDHLGLIGGDRKMSTYDRVSVQARELKELAKRFNVTVVLAVQVNREAGGDGSKELHLGSARDSGVVEEAMDYLIAMRRLDRSQTLPQADRERYRDVLFARVVKNRHGAPDTEIAVRIDPRTLRLAEDPTIAIAQDDLARIAAQAGSRRR